MKFDPALVRGKLIRRYKRFLADVTLEDGSQITASVPNTGSMRGLTEPGSPVWLSVHDTGNRKYRHSLQIVQVGDVMVGINTALPNRIAQEAIDASLIDNLSDYQSVKREQNYGENSRIDILLDDGPGPKTYVEVKNVHFSRTAGLAEFPDSKTERGAKHLRELSAMVDAGFRAIMLYVVQRNDCDALGFCHDLDPVYCEAYREARNHGVEAYAIRCQINEQAIEPADTIPIVG